MITTPTITKSKNLEENFFSLTKDIYARATMKNPVNIIFMGKAFIQDQEQNRVSILTTSIQLCTSRFRQGNWARRKKGIQVGNKEMKLSLLAYDRTLSTNCILGFD